MYKCNVCDCEFSEDDGGLIEGAIGIIPVSFCPTCLSGLFDMVDTCIDIEEIELELQKSVRRINQVRNLLRSRINGG